MRKRADTAGSVLSPQVTLAGGSVFADGSLSDFSATVPLVMLLFGATVPLVMLLFGVRSHARSPSPVPRIELGENMDFDGLQLAIRSWSCRSANKASRLDIG